MDPDDRFANLYRQISGHGLSAQIHADAKSATLRAALIATPTLTDGLGPMPCPLTARDCRAAYGLRMPGIVCLPASPARNGREGLPAHCSVPNRSQAGVCGPSRLRRWDITPWDITQAPSGHTTTR